MDKPNITKLTEKLLHTDNSPVNQPPGTTRFVLNGVVETNEGDRKFIANEEANDACYSLPDGFIPIGKTYMSNGRTVLLSVSSDDSISEIGIADDNCNYQTIVNDENSINKLGFKLSNQIDVIYRLRRGCEDTIYFVDGPLNKPRYFNFNKFEDFQTNDLWDARKFELVRSYEKVPFFNNIEVLNSGGQIEPGSVNIAIQYVDEDLNPTEWIITSAPVNIYNDDSDESFLEIRGSVNSDSDYIDFPTTDKAIRVDLDNLDEGFLFYRLAFIEANNGSGIVNEVKFTENIPISKKFFIYTGNNFATTGTEEEIQTFTQIIDGAGHIEQIDNRLILSDTIGKQVNFCKLQKYVSRIKTDLRVKQVLSNQISNGNPKNPTVNLEAAGYMPGEMYSFGLVWVFADGSISPTYHIPGKNPNTGDNVVYTPTDTNIYGMSNNNASLNNLYIDNSNCSEYWAVDAEGDVLTNQPVRHHRFPLRSEIRLPLVEEIDSNLVDTIFYQIKFSGSGTITLPCTQEEFDAGECTPVQEAPLFQARIEFTVDGVPQSLTVQIDPQGESTPFEFEEVSNLFTSNNIIVTGIFESVEGVIEDVSTGGIGTASATGGPSTSTLNQLNYIGEVQQAEFTSEERLFRHNVYGVQFSGIEIPSLDDTNGEEIVGYYIVRNERTESEKTILDSAVLTPSVTNTKYISHGLLGPELDDTDRLSKKVFGLINPEFKFNDIKYNDVTDVIQEGEFNIIDRKKSKARYRDVTDGTSFDSDIHKGGGGNDEDGWSLKVISRDNITSYATNSDFNKVDNDIENIFYLNALESRDINNDDNVVYNISGDNKVGILQLKEDYNEDLRDKIPYVYLRREISDSYSTFRTLPYYKVSNNISDESVTSVFGGDTFTTPMRYVNTVFWDNRIAERAGRTSVWNYVLGAVLIIGGALLSILTLGLGAIGSTFAIASGIAILGGGALLVASGVRKDALIKAYQEEYDKGLRETALDNWTEHEYEDLPCTRDCSYTDELGQCFGRCDTPEDDEIQWIGDCVTDLWFESTINMSIRNGFAVDTPTFIDAPGRIETGYNTIEPHYEHFGVYKIKDNKIIPTTVLDKHLMDKLVVFNPEREDSREYIGHSLGEYYNINADYKRINRQKIFSHLALEYDCCSDCQEQFPHRNHYSEQSFQEELTDNYRVFLPNNYRDIPGEKGKITNTYRLQNNFYIHTEEALWHLPQNFQERVTGDIISFLGTGSYFETPPRLITDADETSAGCTHKWSAHKSKNGILFASERESKWYLFNGNELKPISEYNNSNWFRNHMKSIVAEQYYNATGRQYPYLDNPSNPYGEGFISTYDSRKERLIITKKDFSLTQSLQDSTDYELCFNDDNVTIFNNYLQTIQTYENNNFEFVGIENCRMKFSKIEYEEVVEQRQVTTVIPPDTIIVPFFDTTSMIQTTIDNISATIDAWFPGFKASINGGVNNLTLVNPGTWNQWATERWVDDPAQLVLDNLGAGLDILMLVFVDESNNIYHGNDLLSSMTSPTADYISDAVNFTGTLHPQFASIKAINYPIVRNTEQCKTYLQHAIAAIKGENFTVLETDTLEQNPFFTVGEWQTLKDSLLNNTYSGQPILRDFGWSIKENRVDGIDNNGTADCPVDGVSILTECQFTIDVQELLESTITVELVNVTTQVPVTTTIFVDGEILEEDIVQSNNSWTMSFDLKEQSWIGWHSYLPNFYFYIAEKFYNWTYGSNSIFKHNKVGQYQTFNGVYYPHIIEYVSVSSPLTTKIWDWLRFQTEAKQYIPAYNDFVDKRFITHNKMMIYNTRQNSGILSLIPKNEDANYLMMQIINSNTNEITIDRNERDWHVNDFRDIRVDYDTPMFTKLLSSIQSEYFIDKVLNQNTINVNKDWTQLENFRDKFLVIRFIFDNFDNIRLITNYSIEPESQSNS